MCPTCTHFKRYCLVDTYIHPPPPTTKANLLILLLPKTLYLELSHSAVPWPHLASCELWVVVILITWCRWIRRNYSGFLPLGIFIAFYRFSKLFSEFAQPREIVVKLSINQWHYWRLFSFHGLKAILIQVMSHTHTHEDQVQEEHNLAEAVYMASGPKQYMK